MNQQQPDRHDLTTALTEQLCHGLSVAMVVHLQTIAEQVDLNVTDLKCLGLLRDGRSFTAGQIAEHTGLTTGAVTGVVDRLERAGFVERGRDPRDRRRVLVTATPGRIEVIAALFAPLCEQLVAVLSNYRVDQLETLSDFCRRVVEVLRSETKQIRTVEDGRPGQKSLTKM